MADPIPRLGQLLETALRGSALEPGLRRQGALDAWDEIVGPQIAQHSRAIGLSDGVLLVQVDGSVWAQELSMLRGHIQNKLDAQLGEGAVREVRFRSGRLHDPASGNH